MQTVTTLKNGSSLLYPEILPSESSHSGTETIHVQGWAGLERWLPFCCLVVSTCALGATESRWSPLVLATWPLALHSRLHYDSPVLVGLTLRDWKHT